MSTCNQSAWPGLAHVPQERYYPLLMALAHWAETSTECLQWILTEGLHAPLLDSWSTPPVDAIRRWHGRMCTAYAASGRFGPQVTVEARSFVSPMEAVTVLAQSCQRANGSGARLLAAGHPGDGGNVALHAAAALAAAQWLLER